MIIIILVVLILMCGIGGYSFPQPGFRWGLGGLGTILFILLILMVLGFVKM